jgi:hypothetical protein
MLHRRFEQANPLKPAFPKKQSACEPKPNCFHLARLGTK